MTEVLTFPYSTNEKYLYFCPRCCLRDSLSSCLVIRLSHRKVSGGGSLRVPDHSKISAGALNPSPLYPKKKKKKKERALGNSAHPFNGCWAERLHSWPLSQRTTIRQCWMKKTDLFLAQNGVGQHNSLQSGFGADCISLREVPIIWASAWGRATATTDQNKNVLSFENPWTNLNGTFVLCALGTLGNLTSIFNFWWVFLKASV